MNRLPAEIIDEILSYLDLNDWCHCRQSSKMFHLYNDKRIHVLSKIKRLSLNPLAALTYSCKIGDSLLVKHFLSKGALLPPLNYRKKGAHYKPFTIAIKHRQNIVVDLYNYLISLNNEYYRGFMKYSAHLSLLASIKYDNIKMVHYFLNHVILPCKDYIIQSFKYNKKLSSLFYEKLAGSHYIDADQITTLMDLGNDVDDSELKEIGLDISSLESEHKNLVKFFSNIGLISEAMVILSICLNNGDNVKHYLKSSKACSKNFYIEYCICYDFIHFLDYFD